MRRPNPKLDIEKGRRIAFLSLFLFTMASGFLLTNCTSLKTNPMVHNKTPDKKNKNGYLEFSCEVISKPFVNKRGQKTNRVDYYLRRSIQDYFIKFCESSISQSDLESHLKLQENKSIKMIRVEADFNEGSWDDCGQGDEVESRMGEYAIIKRIF